MTRILAAAALALSLAVPVKAADVGTIWNELFNVEEQRVLFAMMADPGVESALKGDFSKVLAAEGSADAYKYEKAKLQARWLTKIFEFSRKYQAQDAALMARMKQLPKPQAGEVRKAVPWFAEVDSRDWGGALIAAAVEQMNAHEAGYSLASLRSFTPTQREEMLGQLGTARAWGLKAGTVAGKLLSATQEKFNADLSKAGGGAPARAELAKQKMNELAPTLARREETPSSAREQLDRAAEESRNAGSGSLDDARENGRTFDGNGKHTGSAPAVDGRSSEEAPSLDDSAGELQPSRGIPGGLTFSDIPPPQSTDEKISAGGGGVLTLLKSPKVGGGIGALLGGILGFFLGGPIGAAVGAAVVGGGAYLALNSAS